MALLDVLIPDREQRILRALVLHKDAAYSFNELIRIGGASKSAGAAIVDRFVDAGLALEERLGNQRRIRFNAQWPLADEMRSMCVKSFGVAEPIGEALAPLLDRIEIAFIFGSVVKGTDHVGSDIDLMVVGDLSSIDLLEALQPVQESLKRPVNFNLYSSDEWQTVQSDAIVATIMKGPRVTIHERTNSAKPAELAPDGASQRAHGRSRVR